MVIRRRTTKVRSGGSRGRIFITLIGVLFIGWGVLSMGLGLFGAKGDAVITHIRRQGGERNEVIRGRYTYAVAYSFDLPDGRRIDGTTTKIGDSVYLKATGTSRRPVRYYSFLPQINALEEDTGLKTGPVVLVAVGALLIALMREKRAGRR
jgi:hypothetical protein